MNPNQNLQIPLFHTTYQYHWILIRKRGPYWYDTGKSHTLYKSLKNGLHLYKSALRSYSLVHVYGVYMIARPGLSQHLYTGAAHGQEIPNLPT